MIQEDEVDGVDPIIRVWNLDKVQIAVFFFDACNMLLKSLQEKLCHVNQTCNTCTQITCFNPCLGFIVGLSWIKGWGLVLAVGGGGGGGGLVFYLPPPPPPATFIGTYIAIWFPAYSCTCLFTQHLEILETALYRKRIACNEVVHSVVSRKLTSR